MDVGSYWNGVVQTVDIVVSVVRCVTFQVREHIGCVHYRMVVYSFTGQLRS